MNLKFWKRGQESADGGAPKLPRPKELPNRVGIYMVTRLKEDPDWVWELRAAMRPNTQDRKVQDIRIFSPKEAAGKNIVVRDFNTLDSCPEIILFSGWFNKDSGEVRLEKAALRAA